MATSARDLIAAPMAGFGQMQPRQKMTAMIVGAAIIAAVIGLWMWSANPDYKVLFSNLDQRDGGQVIDALQKMNIPYKVSEGGSAILVPADKVYETRLKLGAQGLPKGSGVGFELLDKEKIGTSQFVEQVNYQRALEGELAQSIESLSAVAAARVHLALPKQSVFIRDQEKPSASVILTLYNGRYLDGAQVSGIVHLVSSSVPNLSPDRISVVDQSGKLLTRPDGGQDLGGLNPTQLEYVHKVEKGYAKRIEDILAPIVGSDGVQAEVAADVDFSQTERTSETYDPKNTAIRSQQQVFDQSVGVAGPMGVPGALSNQPPAASSAPFTAPTGSAASSVNVVAPTSSHSESTVNYEVDKTISHTKDQTGVIKRLSVAVVVNNRPVQDKSGKIVYRPLQPAELAQVSSLVRDAIGFNAARGDSVNVVNMAFNGLDATPNPVSVPWWKQFDILAMAKYGVYLLLGLFAYFALLRPLIKSLTRPAEFRPAEARKEMETHVAVPVESSPGLAAAKERGESSTPAPDMQALMNASAFDTDLVTAKRLVEHDPKKAAQVVREWLSSDG